MCIDFKGNVDVAWRLESNMSFCPLDYRYGCQDFKRIWSEVGRHERQLEVERALIWAHMQLGRVTEEDYNIVAAIANPDSVTKERVSEIEAETRHDIMALTKARLRLQAMLDGVSILVRPLTILSTQPSLYNYETALFF